MGKVKSSWEYLLGVKSSWGKIFLGTNENGDVKSSWGKSSWGQTRMGNLNLLGNDLLGNK